MRALPGLLLAASMACPTSTNIPTRNSVALPKAARAVVDQQYPKWHVTTVRPAGDCAKQVETRSTQVAADFNTDGFDDYALQILTSSGTHLIVVMTWLDTYHTIELESSSDTIATRFLDVEKRGASFKNPQTGGDDYFANDTLVTRSCGPDRIAYFWRGADFEKVVLPE